MGLLQQKDALGTLGVDGLPQVSNSRCVCASYAITAQKIVELLDHDAALLQELDNVSRFGITVRWLLKNLHSTSIVRGFRTKHGGAVALVDSKTVFQASMDRWICLRQWDCRP